MAGSGLSDTREDLKLFVWTKTAEHLLASYEWLCPRTSQSVN